MYRPKYLIKIQSNVLFSHIFGKLDFTEESSGTEHCCYQLISKILFKVAYPDATQHTTRHITIPFTAQPYTVTKHGRGSSAGCRPWQWIQVRRISAQSNTPHKPFIDRHKKKVYPTPYNKQQTSLCQTLYALCIFLAILQAYRTGDT